MTVWLDGELLPQGHVPLDDRGLLLGDGIFDTLLTVEGTPLFLDRHYRRLAEGAEVMGFDLPMTAGILGQAITDVIAANGLEAGYAAVRTTVTRGAGHRGLGAPETPAPRVAVTAAAITGEAPPAAHLAFARTRRNEGSATSRIKSLSYADNVLARSEAVAAGADDAVMLNNAGRVACAPAGNLLVVRDGVVTTPPIEDGVLAGTVRAVLLAGAARHGVRLRSEPVTIDMLAGAEAVAITNSLLGVRPVASLQAPAVTYAGDHPSLLALQRCYCEAASQDIARMRLV